MSVKIMNLVWECEHIKDRGELCIMLALADWSNDAGEAYPSVPQLAKKARLSRRGVQTILDRLKGRLVTWEENTGGRSRRNQYTLNLAALKGAPSAGFDNEERVHPVQGLESTKGCSPRQIKGAPGAPAINHHLKPSLKEYINNPYRSVIHNGGDDDEREVVFDLSFLHQKDLVYSAAIQDELKLTPRDQIDFAYVRILRGQHRGAAPLPSLLELQKTYGHERLVAAMVYARSEGTGTASLKFLKGIMDRWGRPDPEKVKTIQSAARPERTQWQPIQDDMSFLEELPVTGTTQ